MKQISLGYHLRHVATMLIAISAVTLNGDPTDDPFRPGAYPASVRRLSWDATSAFPNPNWGEGDSVACRENFCRGLAQWIRWRG